MESDKLVQLLEAQMRAHSVLLNQLAFVEVVVGVCLCFRLIFFAGVVIADNLQKPYNLVEKKGISHFPQCYNNVCQYNNVCPIF